MSYIGFCKPMRGVYTHLLGKMRGVRTLPSQQVRTLTFLSFAKKSGYAGPLWETRGPPRAYRCAGVCKVSGSDPHLLRRRPETGCCRLLLTRDSKSLPSASSYQSISHSINHSITMDHNVTSTSPCQPLHHSITPSQWITVGP